MSVRGALLWSFRQVLRIYFRKVHAAGDLPSEDVGGRLFAPNHVNGLVDPLLVLTTSRCRVSPIGKAPLWKIPVLGALLDAVGAVPVVRRRDDPGKAQGSNDEIFEKVGAHLAGAGNVLIFPEGTSHNEPGLVKIRTGPARMLLRAVTKGSAPTFQAVGLEFEARESFRSRVLVLYGPVRLVRDVIGGAAPDSEEAVRAVSQAIEHDLASLVVTGESWEERRLISRVAELLASTEPAPEGGAAEFLRWSELARGVREAAKALADAPADVDPIRAKVSTYFDALEADGLVDADVRDPDRPLRRGRVSPITMIAALPLALIGAVLWAIPYRVPRLVASRATEADVVSTFKLATGLVVFPVWAVFIVTVAFLLGRPIGAAVLAATILTPLPTLWWVDAFEDGLLRPRKTSAALRVLRDEALGAIARARAKLPATPEDSSSR